MIETFLQVTIYVIAFIASFILFVVAGNDITHPENSETSLFTKILEGLYVLIFVGAVIGAVFTAGYYFVVWAVAL